MKAGVPIPLVILFVIATERLRNEQKSINFGWRKLEREEKNQTSCRNQRVLHEQNSDLSRKKQPASCQAENQKIRRVDCRKQQKHLQIAVQDSIVVQKLFKGDCFKRKTKSKPSFPSHSQKSKAASFVCPKSSSQANCQQSHICRTPSQSSSSRAENRTKTVRRFRVQHKSSTKHTETPKNVTMWGECSFE